MRITDLTHHITPDMPVYPGTEPPVIIQACSINRHGFNEKKYTMFSHTGTHIDGPAHIFEAGKFLEDLDISHFCGTAVVLDCAGFAGKQIPADTIKEQLSQYTDLHHDPYNNPNNDPNIEFIILGTGWHLKWGRPDYFNNYPVLTTKAAEYLSRLGLKGVGTDTISIDPFDAAELVNHRILLAQNTLIIENLTNLAGLAGRLFTFSCLPLKILAADGSPVRAVAIE